MSKVFDTTRVPGFNCSSSLGFNFKLMRGSRNSVTTVASEKFASNRSPNLNSTRSSTPFFLAFSLVLDSLRIYVDPHTAGAELLRGGDHDAPIAAAEVVEDVGLLHFAQL